MEENIKAKRNRIETDLKMTKYFGHGHFYYYIILLIYTQSGYFTYREQTVKTVQWKQQEYLPSDFFIISLSKYCLISIIRLIINILRKIYINEQNYPQFW